MSERSYFQKFGDDLLDFKHSFYSKHLLEIHSIEISEYNYDALIKSAPEGFARVVIEADKGFTFHGIKIIKKTHHYQGEDEVKKILAIRSILIVGFMIGVSNLILMVGLIWGK